VGMNSSLHDRIDDVIRMQWPPEGLVAESMAEGCICL